MTTESRRFTAAEAAPRLDRFLAGRCPDLTRSRLAWLVREGMAAVNGAPCRPSQPLRAGDVVDLTVPPPTPLDLAPEDIPVPILYEDDDLLVVDKPAGLTVHPAPGHPSHTLVNALLALRPNLSGIGGRQRPGIVHRLDKDTSGLMLVAKHDAVHHALAAQLQARRVHKRYLAMVWGCPRPESGTVDAPIARHPADRKRMAVVQGGRDAVTHYAVLQRFPDASLVEARPVTGRTHQVRVHLAHLGCPLLGDALYSRGRPAPIDRHFLHAAALTFRHPSTGETIEVSSPPPPGPASHPGRLHPRIVGAALVAARPPPFPRIPRRSCGGRNPDTRSSAIPRRGES